MGTRSIADRLLSKLLGTGKALISARRRALATNGTDQERRALVKQPELEASVLVILARRGPDDVTMSVARHPSLELETARNLVRIKSPSLASALQNRFGDSLYPGSGSTATFSTAPVAAVQAERSVEVQTAQPDLLVTDEVLAAPTESPPMPAAPRVVTMAGSAEDQPTVEASDFAEYDEPVIDEPADARQYPVKGIVAPTSTQSATQMATPWSLEDFRPQAPLGTDSLLPDTIEAESAKPTDTDDELDFHSAVEQFEVDLDRLAPLLGQDLADAPRKSAGRTDRYDEAAEIRFVKAFQRIPDGPVGERLLAALSQAANAPKLHKLIELYRAGLDVDDMAVAWTVRENWNAANGDQYSISYRVIGAIVRSFRGTPDPDEVLQLLGLLRDNFHLTQPKEARFFYRYADELADSLEVTEKSGRYMPPLDILATARNYH